MKRFAFFVFCFSSVVGSTHAARLKDIVEIKGARDNQLIGYGLVVGLGGTGDSKLDATSRSLAQMFRQMGVDVPEKVDSKNVAAVIVTANLPAFARTGNRLDVLVNSVGDAKSLAGGTLLVTPLKGADQNVYAVAQGPLALGGGGSGSKVHPTVARVPSGGIVEKELGLAFDSMKSLRLSLLNADFTTSARMAKVINLELGGKYATPRDSRTLDLIVPYQYENRVVDFIALLENLEVTTDTSSRVVINERTGTIVIGEGVAIDAVSVAHGDLTISVEDIAGKARDTASSSKKGGAEKVSVMELPAATQIKDVVRVLNALGVKPRDLIDILQAMRSSGALHAKVEIQ